MKTFRIALFIFLIVPACSYPTAQAPAATEAPISITAIPTPEPIVHTIFPAAGTRARATAHDNENSTTFDTKKVAGGDDFVRERYERPFTAGEMVYLPDIDIVDFSISSDDQFFYILISFVGLDLETQSLTGFYGVEIDRNADGRAEIMLTTSPPYGLEYTPDNVVLSVDLNGDVGGSKPSRPDDFEGNGFEGIIYDLSRNVFPDGDPDLAWVHQTTDGDHPAIEIAYRKWIFQGGDEAFMWNVISSDSPLDPTHIYFHDNLTEEQAGSPNTDNPNYPLKELAAMDNSCRVPLGFTAGGGEPMGCFVKGPERVIEEEPPATAGSISTDDALGPVDARPFCGQFSAVCGRVRNVIVDGSSNTIFVGEQ